MDTKIAENPQVSSDERLLGMLSHLSIFLGGIILPIILWATQKDKSQFVRFHSLQAIFFHVAYLVFIILYVMLMVLVMLISGIGLGIFSASHHNAEPPAGFFIILIVFYAGIFVMIFAGIAYAIYLAIKTYQGNLVKIPFIGRIIYDKVYGRQN